MKPAFAPSPEALARIRSLTERILSPEEVRAALAVPLGEAEEEEARSLIRWFRRRYPTPGERLAYVDKGEQEGAKLLEDGRKTRVPGHEQGFFLGPCLFDDVKPQMSIYTDEIFGPVLSVVRTGSYDDALALVNSNRYANGVAIFTNDGGAARRFQNEVQVGMVGVNVPIPVPMAYYSFGGWKSSLFGDSHVHGREGIHFYTRGKVVTSRWPDPHHRGVNLGFPQMK